ncbi:MAG: tRNA (adenosine(37)-N6)-dimethylallyltransferase MiaA [Bacilli bacterium]
MIYVICGPTASGKSTLAYKLKKYFDCPVINCDSFQIYKELNIGTAKPTSDELKEGNYYLYNLISASSSMSIFDFQKIFRTTIDNLLKTNKNIVVVGGSGLYIKSSFYDYQFVEDEQFVKLPEAFEKMSNHELYMHLQKIDEGSAVKLHENNRKRVMRALEISLSGTGKKSEFEEKQKHVRLYKDATFIGLDINRDNLYKKINDRVEEMFSLGLEKEAKDLLKEFGPDTQALQAIGYKEFAKYNEEEVKDKIKQFSRNYAKRQMTFFKNQFEEIKWFSSIDEAYSFCINQ